MKKFFDIKHTFWHFLTTYGFISEWRETVNICQIIRACLIGSILVLVAILASAWGISLVLSFPVAVFVYFFQGLNFWYVDTGHVIVSTLLWSIVGIYFCYQFLVKLINKLITYTYQNKNGKIIDTSEKEPGLISLMYKSFKEKTCFYVDVKDWK